MVNVIFVYFIGGRVMKFLNCFISVVLKEWRYLPRTTSPYDRPIATAEARWRPLLCIVVSSFKKGSFPYKMY